MVTEDERLSQAKAFVLGVDDRMPQWDADEAFARYEHAEIAAVKADIAAARVEEDQGRFMEDVDKLRADFDALCALDQKLHREVWA
jgi:hypothetical protein